MLQSLPLEVLADEKALAAFLEEMIDTAIEKYAVKDGKIPARASGIIRGYVVSMVEGLTPEKLVENREAWKK